MKNILITGANGQLGNEMRIVAKHSDLNFIFTDISSNEGCDTHYLDICNREAVIEFVQRNEVDAIINCAAYTNVDMAESDKESCYALNATAPENLAIAIQQRGGLLIHISTDYVFGGDEAHRPLTEDDECNPKSIYGKTKLLGEQAIRATNGDYVIIRTSWLYSEYGKNFCKTMIALTESKPEIRVVNDQLGTPTYALDLAKAIIVVLTNYDSTKRGIYHFSNEGACTWYDFAIEIAKLNLSQGSIISPCSSDEYPTPVRRPHYSVLDKGKIRRVFNVATPDWRDSLSVCINNIKASK